MEQIFDLVVSVSGPMYGVNSNFTFTELYEMPVNLRSFYYQKYVILRNKMEEMAEQATKNKGKGR